MHWLVIVVIAILVTWLGFRNAKKRTAEISVVAQQMGFKHEPTGIPFSGFEAAGIQLFTLGLNKQATNVLIGMGGGRDMRVFDYQYTETSVGSGDDDNNTDTTYRQTVAAFHVNGAGMPNFRVHPTGMLSKVARGMQKDILFDGHERFNKEYHLKGLSPEAVRAFFTPQLIAVFEAHDHKHRWSVEGCGDWLICFREHSIIKPADLPAFVQATADMANALLAGMSLLGAKEG